ncbi:aminotransferase class I/II-fold pyridoxal phosphate-dependent enzyme [Branchiibius sp. NY16-3462-2]|uniref:MalY/PatB family protein n=1 Tax=Branchiibius sp. NY16-3462-2 TaxID=1807500 RepID=UPI00079BADC6|nr:aminotransferase class I/II-fold pyridoxal phosphate-dependent enzyme [Branchiibius sp. NY16-3462-2]KYH44496.1 cystathionine beta-lyase [Branchiibius sp. NY16-3462-2]
MTMHPLRDLTLEQLRSRTSVKWRAYPPDVLPAFVAEMDAHPIPAVVEAVTRAMRDGDTGYPAGSGYAETFAQFSEQTWGWRWDPARALPIIDVVTGLALAIEALTDRGDTVVLSSPVYGPFFMVIERTGRTLLDAALTSDGRLDPVALESAFQAATRGGRSAAYLLCNPHNPSSVVHTADELAGLAQLADRYGVRVVSDEIHAPLVASGFTPYLDVLGTERALTVTSASKAFNLAGLKGALVIAGTDAMPARAAISRMVGALPSHLGSIAHTAALRGGRDWLTGLQQDLEENRELLRELLNRELPQVGWGGDPGTYLAWLDCRDLGLGDDPAEHFLTVGRVALAHGRDFGPTGAGFARLNLATTPELLTEAVARIRRSL